MAVVGPVPAEVAEVAEVAAVVGQAAEAQTQWALARGTHPAAHLSQYIPLPAGLAHILASWRRQQFA